ncbi:hypothetical protein EV193_110235 [Herbihabitans rhizosphaerae]|uniref:Lysylphosphatidylglycerol synthase-like protein n=1 Tax=Herbihabitans rhizosphaerae TaxID=1872711 RepID=A0A4Q7KIP1_9PSEU|nr:hypothetical protein EV193_110235 [Herbihabitans rhizosphaerae]
MVDDDRAKHRTRWRPRLLVGARIAGVLAVLAVVAIMLHGQLPEPADVMRSLRAAEAEWLLVAVLAEMASMGLFARQQRRLLTAFGVTMPRHRAVALAYSRSAIAISLPAGSALSAAFAFRQFRTDGASRTIAATVMILSGLLSMGALVLLYAMGFLATATVHVSAALSEQPILPMLAAHAVIVAVGIGWLATRQLPRRGPRRPHPTRWPRLAKLLRPVAEAVRSSRDVAPRHWALALGAALANWLTDLACLAAAATAFHLDIGVVELAAIYLTVQVVRQIPLTPGGVGVIELSLLTGLLAAGAEEAPAAATVLVYRLLSCWLIIPLGFVGWLVLKTRRSDRVAGATPDQLDTVVEGPASLGEDGVGVGPRRDVRDEQPPDAGTARQFAGLPP